MSMHQVEIEYKIVEGTTFRLDLDPALDPGEQEEIILAEFKETFVDGEDITDIEIVNIKELN
jgi:hypothetical protein